ncbi:MAG: hypothetical protein ACSLFN_00635 [Candidatus Limnocylindrales bacterium]
MDPRTAATPVTDPDAVEFVRFCYRRRRVGWPELYDEMCAVANRGLFRGYDADDLATHGIAFGLFDMPALAALASRIVEDEKALRRPMTVVITDLEPIAVPIAPPVSSVPLMPAAETSGIDVRIVPAAERPAERVFEREPEVARETPIRFRVNPVPAGV